MTTAKLIFGLLLLFASAASAAPLLAASALFAAPVGVCAVLGIVMAAGATTGRDGEARSIDGRREARVQCGLRYLRPRDDRTVVCANIAHPLCLNAFCPKHCRDALCMCGVQLPGEPDEGQGRLPAQVRP